MKLIFGVLTAIALGSAPSAWADDAPAPKASDARYEPNEHYTTIQIEGWQVLVHQTLLEEKAELGRRVLALMRQILGVTVR